MTTLYVLMLIGGCLVALGVIAGLYSTRLGFSHLLVFLCVGMFAGVDGPLGLPFDDYRIAFGVGNIALAMILLDGGLRTSGATLRAGLLPASLLATVGVAVTSALAGAAAMWALDLDWRHGLLLGAVISSTDAAAVFSQLGRARHALPQRLAATIEVESGLNDPMAVFLVLSLIALIKAPAGDDAGLLALFAHHAGWGTAIGLGSGLIAAAALKRLPLGERTQGLTALLLTAAGLVVFALAGLADGSAFVAVYLFGLVLAQRARRTVRSALAALDGYTWLAQAGLFLLLGLLVTPHDLLLAAGPALAVAAALMLIARPLAVGLCLTPLRFGWREQALVAAVGLRGAVPIVLAVYPVMAGIDGAYRFFDVAFVVVLSSLLLQGPALGWLARRLGLVQATPAAAEAAAARAATGPA